MKCKLIWRTLKLVLLLSLMLITLAQESPPPGEVKTQISRLIAAHTFDYLNWELGALYAKGEQMAVPVQDYLSDSVRKELVLRYMDLLRLANQTSQQITELYSNPEISDPEAASQEHRAEYHRLRNELAQMQTIVESILEEQVSTVLAGQGLAIGGQVVPPVKIRFTPLPQQLVISPRHEIRRLYEFSLEAGLTVDRAAHLEDEVDHRFNVSSLVVPIGGMGLYPTMLLESDSLEWVVGVAAHEWTHNWLTLFPIGWHYGASPELTTMNETTANIVENEIRPLVLARFYPEMATPPAPIQTDAPAAPESPPAFDFRQELRLTRIEVDRLLQEGKIAEAEAYMEARRQVFWEQGYHIRKLNQAYFAFHGAYADAAGAAGDDPVGPAVVQLRQQSRSLKDFLLTLAPMTSFEDLQRALTR